MYVCVCVCVDGHKESRTNSDCSRQAAGLSAKVHHSEAGGSPRMCVYSTCARMRVCLRKCERDIDKVCVSASQQKEVSEATPV